MPDPAAADSAPAALPGAHLNNLDTDPEPSTGESILKVIQRFALKSVAWVAIYSLGYFDFSVAWLVTPLLLTVMRWVHA